MISCAITSLCSACSLSVPTLPAKIRAKRRELHQVALQIYEVRALSDYHITLRIWLTICINVLERKYFGMFLWWMLKSHLQGQPSFHSHFVFHPVVEIVLDNTFIYFHISWIFTYMYFSHICEDPTWIKFPYVKIQKKHLMVKKVLPPYNAATGAGFLGRGELDAAPPH